ncbi:adenylyl-sulfate kinase [Candidatus Dependentiae bacterium]|nr:adenylyl-sulfate kinase [Candidatus Dependentiae bacterium]
MNQKIDKNMQVVIVGHVDHGKSTIIGRLMADTKSLPVGKLEDIKELCRRNSKPFEYAFLLDALKNERAQGITIDSSRCFFKTAKRKYIIIDAPGHIEFLKNMISGAARGEAALLVIAADEGIRENSKRHAYMLSMLGIKQITVLVNKMDLTDYSEAVFKNICSEFKIFLKSIGINDNYYIPVSGMNGDNISERSECMPWYKSRTVLEAFDEFENDETPENKFFRMPVQGVYKFTLFGDNRRIIAGKVETGKINIGDEIVFFPSGKKSKIKTIEGFNLKIQPTSAVAGYSAGITLDEQIYVKRGEMAVRQDEIHPNISTRLKANIFWLGNNKLLENKEYTMKICTSRIKCRIEKIEEVLDASSLEKKYINFALKNEVAKCIVKFEYPVTFDTIDKNQSTGRFVLIDDYEISGGGIIYEALDDNESDLREKVYIRNYKWEKSIISKFERSRKYSQKPCIILITGLRNSGKKPLAKMLEKSLFEFGQIVYFLGIGNLLYGVDSDIKFKEGDFRKEHLRRLGEIANILIDAGNIFIVTATEINSSDMDILNTLIERDFIRIIWNGEKPENSINCDLNIGDEVSVEEKCSEIIKFLQNQGIIFNPL